MGEDANGARSVSKTGVEGSTPSAHANARKEKQLGMSFGKACHRLRKMVMFHLLVRLGENVCFRCGEIILSLDELSLEAIRRKDKEEDRSRRYGMVLRS